MLYFRTSNIKIYFLPLPPIILFCLFFSIKNWLWKIFDNYPIWGVESFTCDLLRWIGFGRNVIFQSDSSLILFNLSHIQLLLIGTCSIGAMLHIKHNFSAAVWCQSVTFRFRTLSLSKLFIFFRGYLSDSVSENLVSKRISELVSGNLISK